MKEFTTAVQDIEAEDEREAAILAIMDKATEGETITREQAEAQYEKDNEEPYVGFLLDGREMHAYHPNDGQMAFMLANMGRGQSNTDRFAAIVNVMLSCLRDEDRDIMESRLLSRKKSERLPIEQVEGIFAYLTEEWFGRPTQ